MRCPNCGTEAAENRRFCGRCGTALAGMPAPAAAETVSPPSTWGSPPPAPAAAPGPADGPDSGLDPFAPPNLGAPPGWGAPPPGYGAQPGSAPPPGYPPPGYPQPPGYPPPGYGYPPTTSGLAVASLVLSIVGWLPCGVGSVLGVVFGFIARDQIKRSWGRQSGAGIATAGIILGFLGISFWIGLMVVNIAWSG